MKNFFRNFFIFLFVIFITFNLSAQTETRNTEILILGTYHLNNIKDLKPAMLDNLIAKLDSLKFDVVCIENMPAELLYDIQSRNDSAFAELLESFGGDRLSLAEKIQDQHNISFHDAQNEIKDILLKNSLSAEDRKSLIINYIAAADIASAVLQYQYLKENSDFDSTGLSEFVTSQLEEYTLSLNEIYSLAIPIAKKRNLQNLGYIDNFQDEALLMKYFPQFIQDYMDNQDKFEGIGESPVFQKSEMLKNSGIRNNDLTDLFVFLNSKEYQEQDFAAQWEIWLKTNFPSGSDLTRYYLWEMRNLQIAANIMKTAAFYPGKKILVIIGASHKSFLEKYLNRVPGIELIKFR